MRTGALRAATITNHTHILVISTLQKLTELPYAPICNMQSHEELYLAQCRMHHLMFIKCDYLLVQKCLQ